MFYIVLLKSFALRHQVNLSFNGFGRLGIIYQLSINDGPVNQQVANAGFTVWQDFLMVQTTPELCAAECSDHPAGLTGKVSDRWGEDGSVREYSPAEDHMEPQNHVGLVFGTWSKPPVNPQVPGEFAGV